MKKSKLLILISFLALGCNTGSLSSDNPSESLSNTLSSEEILSNEEDSSINSSTYSIDYSELKELKVYYQYGCIDYMKEDVYGDYPYSLLDKVEVYMDNYPVNIELELKKPNFIIAGDYLKISYYGEVEGLPREDIMPPPYIGWRCNLYGEVVEIEYVRNEISMASFEELVDDGLMCVISDTDYTILDIREANQDMTYYVTRGTDGQVLTAYTFNPLEI